LLLEGKPAIASPESAWRGLSFKLNLGSMECAQNICGDYRHREIRMNFRYESDRA
jgi:hypothetical protein